MPDREKYIDVLSNTVKTVKEYNEDTPIKISLQCVEDILALLKEQQHDVLCRDCTHYENCEIHDLLLNHENGYCSDGERNK